MFSEAVFFFLIVCARRIGGRNVFVWGSAMFYSLKNRHAYGSLELF